VAVGPLQATMPAYLTLSDLKAWTWRDRKQESMFCTCMMSHHAVEAGLAHEWQTMAKSGGKMVPDADQVKQILAGIAGQIDEQNSLPPLLSLSVRPFLSLEGSTPENWPSDCAVCFTRRLDYAHDTATGHYRTRCRSHARAPTTVTPDDIAALSTRSP